MKTAFFALFALPLLCVGVARAEHYAAREAFSRTAPFTATGSLHLENVNGNVEIRAWDRNEILIEGEKSAATEEELRQIDLKIDLSEAHARVKVHLPKRTGRWFGSGTIRGGVTFRISLPAAATLEHVGCVNSTIRIVGVHGAVSAKSVNGQIEAVALAGNARLRTVNGNIEAAFQQIGTGRELSFESVNGSVEVQVPADAGLKVHCSVVNGDIDCELPLTLQGRHHGRTRSGTIGDGRSALDARTVNGGIRIGKL